MGPRLVSLAAFVALAASAVAGTPRETRLKWGPLYEPGRGGWITSIAVSPHDPERLVFGSTGRGFFVTRWPRR